MVAEQQVARRIHRDPVEQIQGHRHVRALIAIADERIAAPQNDHLDDRPAAAERHDDARTVGQVVDGAEAGTGNERYRIDAGSTPRASQ